MTEIAEPTIVEALTLAAQTERTGALWALASKQLNANIVRLTAAQAIAEHINDAVDVVGAVLGGELSLGLPTGRQTLRTGAVFFLPRGVTRSLQAGSDGAIYLTCHQRRPGLWPSPPNAAERT